MFDRLCEQLPLLFFSLFSSPPFPVWISILLYTQTVCNGGRGGGVWGRRRGRGHQSDKTPAQSPFTGQYFWITTLHFGIAFFQSNLSTTALQINWFYINHISEVWMEQLLWRRRNNCGWCGTAGLGLLTRGIREASFLLEPVLVPYGSWSESADPYIRLMDPDPDPAIFISDLQDNNKKIIYFLVFLLVTFWRYIYIIFQR